MHINCFVLLGFWCYNLRRITRDRVIYCFSKDIRPVVEVDPGETIVLETLDAASGRVKKPTDVYAYARRKRLDDVNPSTGPVAVRGAEPGDTLVVEILNIKVASRGYRVLMENAGVITQEMATPRALIVKIEGGMAIYDERIKLPIRPMIGTIGVAPAGEAISTLYPGPHGGNMDNNDVTVGTKVYLPVYVPGALLAIGDVHASMGDGELTGGGIDIDGEVTVKVDLIKGRMWPRPWLETKDSWITCANAPTLEDTIAIATRDMVNILTEKLEISKEYAFMLVGSHGDAKIGQAAKYKGLDATVRLVFPKI